MNFKEKIDLYLDIHTLDIHMFLLKMEIRMTRNSKRKYWKKAILITLLLAWNNTTIMKSISKEPKLFSRMSKTLALVHSFPSIYFKGGYIQEWGTYIVILSQRVGELYC